MVCVRGAGRGCGSCAGVRGFVWALARCFVELGGSGSFVFLLGSRKENVEE